MITPYDHVSFSLIGVVLDALRRNGYIMTPQSPVAVTRVANSFVLRYILFKFPHIGLLSICSSFVSASLYHIALSLLTHVILFMIVPRSKKNLLNPRF